MASEVNVVCEDYDPEFSMGDQMFTDLNISRDLGRDYREQCAKLGRSTELAPEVYVLQQSVWPFASRKGKLTAVLPDNVGHSSTSPFLDYSTNYVARQLREEVNHFTEYYQVKFKGRTLYWDHSLGTCTLSASFPKGDKRLTVSLYQAVVLLLFAHIPPNSNESLTFEEIKSGVGMEDAELRRTLQSLACGKKKVLLKKPPGRDVNDGDAFVINDGFEDKGTVVHINSIQSKETVRVCFSSASGLYVILKRIPPCHLGRGNDPHPQCHRRRS